MNDFLMTFSGLSQSPSLVTHHHHPENTVCRNVTGLTQGKTVASGWLGWSWCRGAPGSCGPHIGLGRSEAGLGSDRVLLVAVGQTLVLAGLKRDLGVTGCSWPHFTITRVCVWPIMKGVVKMLSGRISKTVLA